MELNEFVNKYCGENVDFDGVYGAQCVDLFRQYVRTVWDIREHTGAVEGAKDLWLNYPNMPLEKKYFERLDSSRRLKVGDVLVWDATNTNKYGHVAILLGIGDEFLVFEQDGFKQDGAKVQWRSKKKFLGALRKK